MDTMSLTRLFSSLLLDSAAKGTVLLLLAWLAVGLARRSSAALRHSIWCLAMVGLLLLPVASWLLPTWQIPILHPEAATVVEASVPGPTRASLETGESPSIMGNPQSPRTIKQFDVSRPMVDPSMVESPSVVPPVIESPLATQAIVEPTAWSLSTVEWVALVVCAGWILGVILFGTLLLVGLWRTVRMRNRSVVIDDGEWPGMLTELRQRLGLSRSVELREHAESVVPLTWGIWRPVVLVPQVAREWAEPMRRAVLLHELAHVQRGDVACQVLGRLTCVLYWFHPLSWFALRQLRQEREQACDDAVVQSGEKASDYAEQLLAVARLCCAPQGLSLGVAIAEGSSLERRVKSLFDSARSHGPLTRRVAIASLVIGGAILAGLAPIQPTASQAEPVKVETPKPAEPQPAQILESRIQDGEAAKKQMDLLQPVFGKAKRGIQLGLAIGSLERTFPEGGRIPLWLFYHNVGDKEMTFQTTQDFMNHAPTVTDGNGNHVQVSFVMHWSLIAPLTITLKPGEVWCIATTGLNLGEPMPSIKPVAGKYKLTYPQWILDVNTTPQWRTDIPVLPSLPPNISPANPDAPPSPDTPVGQIVETVNWGEQFETGTIEFEIAPGKDGQPEARVLAMMEAVGDKEPVKPVDTLTGVVLDESGRPIAGALVDLWYEIPGKSAVTDEQGAFAIPGLTGTNSPVVMVTKDGHAPAIIERKPDHRVLAIRLCNDTWFEGKVTDADNQPVPDAVVRVSWEQGFKEGVMPFFVETKSQADGSYRLHLCPTGELLAGTEGVIEREGDVLDFRVSSPGRGVARHTHASIEKGAKVPLSFQLEPGIRFEARIVDSVSGEPVEGAVLYTADSPFIHARSDATGRVVFEDQFPATLQLFVGDGEGKAVPECTACDGALEFPSTRFGRWWSPDVATGDNYPPGHLIEPSGEEFPENFNQLFFELQPGMAPAKIFVERSATISGSVTDPEGKPVEGATVVPARNGSSLTGDTRFSIKTDKDGRYVMHIPASKNSTYNLLAHDGGHSEWRNWANGVAVPIQTMPGQTVENADLQLTRPGRVTGRILRKGQPVANYIVRTVASDRLEHSYYNPATKTNADGTFELSHVRPGKHYLQIGYYQYGKDGDQGQVIEVVAGEVVVDQLLEAKDQRDPDEGLVTPPEPEPTVADGAPTPAAKPPVDMAAEPIAEQPAPAGSKTISGQIINDLKLGIPNADVLIVAGGDLNDPREGTVIAQGKTDVLGNYSVAIPGAELGKRSWGQVWRRAPGFAATRGNTMQSLESLTEQPLQHNPLVSTEGLHLVVQDPAGKPLANARVEAISVKVNQGIGYTLPAAWRDDNSGVSDAEGRVHLPYIDPGSLNQLEITPEDSSAATRYTPNYFLNYRPEETAPHFIFPTYKTGTIEGQLAAGPGVTLPKDLKISLMTLTGKVDVAGVREVTVDEAGRFQIPDMPIGEISILKFLDDAQPLRSWISERAFVKADETTKLEIPIVTGTRVTGRVQKSDTQVGVADYEFEVYYGPAIKFRGSDLWLLKHAVKTDAEGKYELFLPPGPINLRLTRHVDGYNDATSWLPDEQQGTWGPLFEIPAQPDFELPSIDLVKMLPIQGNLVDQNDQPLVAFDWKVYGYPEIPGEEDGFVMNSMAGVQTDKTGHFDGTYPETYPPVHWKARHRVWKTKYEFDDIKYAAKVVTRDPLLLRVDTTTPLEE